jgi:SAM-dependent methyltransferase
MARIDDRTASPSHRATRLGHDTRLDYHQRLIADPHRMVAYQRAIERLVKPGMVVLDAGAGTGVLAMMAARAGAAKVYAVESMSVADLARRLVKANGLEGVVEVVQADLRTLTPMAEVDLIVSDCLGRFLIDDQMVEAMDHAFGWLAPGGVVAPSRVELVVAPVSAGHLDLVDTFAFPVLGLELGLVGEAIREGTWGGSFPPAAVLGTPATFAVWDLPGPAPEMATDLDIKLSAGRLIGLAGWMRATLADGIVLDTGPGYETHWHQVWWPVPGVVVEDGDRLEVRVEMVSRDGGPGGEPVWRRQGQVSRDGRAQDRFDLGGLERTNVLIAPTGPRGDEGSSAELDERGAELWEDGDIAGARRCFERAATLGGVHPADQWENLGSARFVTGDFAAAVAPLMMALGDSLTSREQSLRLLVSASFQSGRQRDGERLLEVYEAAFGPHPAGWRRG